MSNSINRKSHRSFRIVIKAGLAVALCLLILLLLSNRPRNDRDWEVGLGQVPRFTINQNQVLIQGLRDFKYSNKNIINFDRIDRLANVNNLERVWLVVEPFTKFRIVAHTYFVFDFKDSDPITVSVEARREKGEKYNTMQGALNQYELIYVWSTESDQTIRRVTLENNRLYMYPLNISADGVRRLFLQMIENTQKLVSQPRYYNTLTSNCTNELAKAANQVKPGAIPWNLAYIFPGLTAEELYKLRLIPTDAPLPEITRKYAIHDIVAKIYTEKDFSKKLREAINKN